jgi:hypothetical protein
MAAFQKFQPFVEALANKVHNLNSDQLKVTLTNTQPAATAAQFSDITEISAGNGFTAGGNISSTVTSTQTDGTYKLVLGDPATWTAAGGSVGPFQWAVLYNDGAANKEVIGYWNYGSPVTLADGESFSVDFDAATGVLTLV